MSIFPYTQLLFESSLAVVICGPHIQILNSRTGDLIHTTADRQGADKDSLLKSGPIRLAAIDRDAKCLATSGDDKLLKLWHVDGLKLLNERELPKKPTALAFTQDGQTVLASDKFGDVFSYDLIPVPQIVEQKNAALLSHENPSGGQLILGHTSFLTAFLLSFDEKFIVTADRDEHIRVSWYPQGYTIESYCLGHEKFVSAIHIAAFCPDELVSGGGDPMLKVWDWMGGRVKREIPILQAVEPYIKVKPARKTPQRFEDDGERDGDEIKKKGKRARALAKQRAKSSSAVGDAPSGVPADVSERPKTADSAEGAGSDEAVLAIQRIASLQSGTDGRHLIFSAVGATALFSCVYSEEDATPAIQAFDFEKPVIDFSVTSDGSIWVCLDGQWSESGADSAGSATTMVRVLRLSDGKLVETSDESPLLTSLNSKCLLPATSSELKNLDIYSSLTALPKNNDTEHDPMDRDVLESAVEGKELSQKELGRLKSKKAVAKAQATRSTGDSEEEEGSSAKRARADYDEDVAMEVVS
ncbi:WD40 repeat-like protein [Mycena pura]|uniref:WD40 repeat-like protein n=1 Tax=Mycena pura TaxID=153505 RepID=A0AAD6YMU5_9AGAR|nr:WD40 repeat-like protein [Mycena pura]